MVGYKDVIHPIIDFGLSFAKTYLIEILLGIPREDIGVNHFDDVQLAFPFLTSIGKGHEFYNLSKSFVKFLVDFAVDQRVNFMGEELTTPVPEKGPLMYLELSKQPKLVFPALVSRIDFLQSIGVE
ncbi:unnamed protein product [Allacma fusca]|uniref:Uncharacterized protein n=1 Tax=Allacma fusca TaxID=39272 RepID=A0A8J2KK83_9HEXA|nr:unnamed protein product [Allacma fusca]